MPPKIMSFKKSLKTKNLTNLILYGDRHNRKIGLRLIDLVLFSVSLYLAIAIRFEFSFPWAFWVENTWKILILIPIQLIIFQFSGIYYSVLRYSSLTLVQDASKAVVLSAIALITLTYFLSDETWPRSILIINALITLVLVVSVRMMLRWLIRKSLFYNKQQELSHSVHTRIVIYGAGRAGAELFYALSHSHQYSVVGFVDDNPDLQRRINFEGLTIYSPKKLLELWDNNYFDSVVLAMPSASSLIRRQIVQTLQRQSIPVLTVPSLAHILSGKVKIEELQRIDIADLLGREEVSIDLELIKRQLEDSSILVTGAGGSIGSELCRQIARQQPACLILYERNEFALYKIHQELSEFYPNIQFVPCLGSVIDAAYLCSVLKRYCVKVLYHAAAYKHVPLLESNIAQGIENNVLGTLTAAQSARESGVSQFVLISTDKAVRPTNIMGATKRIAELTIQALSAQSKSAASSFNTRFAIVRFGNVLGSSGSVVPRFRQQIAQGGPITLTHREITRYFMSIPEAARLVIQAGCMSKGGEVFLLDMGNPIKIYDLAIRMIQLSGLIPGEDIQIQITGLRPGEKLYEELLIAGDSVRSTYHPKIYYGREDFLSWDDLSPKLHLLINQARSNNIGVVKAILRMLVPEYQPHKGTNSESSTAESAKAEQATLTYPQLKHLG